MLAAAPLRWTDPATWPWMFYVWLAVILGGWMVPVWRWLRRKIAAGWPIADGLTDLLFAYVSAHPEEFGALPKPDDT